MRPPITEMEFRMCTCNQSDGDKTCPLHSGVAAPLEPTPQQFLDAWHMHQAGIVRTAGEYLLAVMEAYAAAVSKNLQEELAKAEDMIGHYLKAGYLPHMSAEEARDWLKEITALRETK